MRVLNVLITGTTTGFGRLAALELLRKGHRLITLVRGGADRLSSDLDFSLAIKSGQLHVIDMDLTQLDQLALVKQSVDRIFKSRLDVLINNAGFGVIKPAETQMLQEIRQEFDVNFLSLIHI